ncbi:MFS transporter [Sneathiella aquimaris]|uniref:MFS transporter n=2 Tax=Sneathiella aquimaris TaxID=2599305 RepID=UPI002B1FE423|nr:MFS transporter [Sneathiella aquimaris]
MRSALSACWPLLFGIALMMLGNGLQGSLLGVRANIEGFPTALTGFIMSAYYVGFLFGSIVTPKILVTVGHVRVFAALASLASTTTLLHAVIPDPYMWGIFRIITGFCFAGLYIVSESWLNDVASNETRGQILSFYMTIIWVGMAGGQFLLTVSDPGGYNLFIIVSVLVSFALIPSALTASPLPNMETTRSLGLRQLYKISPLGVIGVFSVGVGHGAFFAMAAVYAGLINLSLIEISTFISVSIIGGALLQMPIGRLSDHFDRRQVIFGTAILAAATGAMMFVLQDGESKLLFLLGAGVFGGFCMPIYSLCLAHTNDYLEPDEMVAASSGLILTNSVGAVIGPLIVSFLMSSFGASAFFVFLATIFAFIGFFTLYRMSIKESVPVDEQVEFVAMPIRSGTMVPVMNPESEEWIEDEPIDFEHYENKDITHPFFLSKASMSIMEDYVEDDDEDDETGSIMDDGPSLWNRNG